MGAGLLKSPLMLSSPSDGTTIASTRAMTNNLRLGADCIREEARATFSKTKELFLQKRCRIQIDGPDELKLDLVLMDTSGPDPGPWKRT